MILGLTLNNFIFWHIFLLFEYAQHNAQINYRKIRLKSITILQDEATYRTPKLYIFTWNV